MSDEELVAVREEYRGVDEHDVVPRLLAEVDWLRTALDSVRKTNLEHFNERNQYIDELNRTEEQLEAARAERDELLRKLENQYRHRAAMAIKRAEERDEEGTPS
jgi:hypothetical protein